MKKFYIILASLFFLVSCNTIEKYDNINLKSPFVEKEEVDVPEEESSHSIGHTTTFDSFVMTLNRAYVEELNDKYIDVEEMVVFEFNIINISEGSRHLNMSSYIGYNPQKEESYNATAYAYFEDVLDCFTIGKMSPNSIYTCNLAFEYTTDGVYTVKFENKENVHYFNVNIEH